MIADRRVRVITGSSEKVKNYALRSCVFTAMLVCAFLLLSGACAGTAHAQSVGVTNVKTSTAWLGPNYNVTVTYTLTNAQGSNVYVRVFDTTNIAIRTINAGLQATGNYAVTWDGRYDNGNLAPYGNYVIKVYATDNGAVPNQPVRQWYSLYSPQGVAVDASGNVYVADTGNNLVRKILPDGTVTTFASGFYYPMDIAIDGSGNLYVADTGNNAVKKITPGGIVTTIATGFSYPRGIAVDTSGSNIYVADTGSKSVKVVSSGGTVTVSYAGFNVPEDVAVDASGNIYVADNGRRTIDKISYSGTVTNFASNLLGPAGIAIDSSGNIYLSDGSYSTIYTLKKFLPGGMNITLSQGLSQPQGIAIDQSSNVYVANTGNNTILKISGWGNVRTFTGFQNPKGLVSDDSNNIYVADYGSNSIKKISSGSVSTFASVNTPSAMAYSGAYGGFVKIYVTDSSYNWIKLFYAGVTSNFTTGLLSPISLTTDSKGNVYLVDMSDKVITKYSSSGSILATKGGGTNNYEKYYDIVADATGNLVTLNFTTGKVDVFSPDLQPVNVYTPAYSVKKLGIDRSTGNLCWLRQSVKNNEVDLIKIGSNSISYTPLVTNLANGSLTFDSQGNLYVSQSAENTVVMITAGSVTTLGGVFNYPYGVAADTSGNVYVADTADNAVKKVSGGITTYVGSGFTSPMGVAMDYWGNIAVVDSSNTLKQVAPDGAVTTLATGFSSPRGVAYGNEYGTVYVADTCNNAVKAYYVNGSVLTIATGFSSPSGIAVDNLGNIYVADTGNNAVKKLSPYGTVVNTYTGFNGPRGVAVDRNNNIYVADTNNGAVKKIVAGTVTTLATGISSPYGILVTQDGSCVYVSDFSGNSVIKISNGRLTTVAIGFNGPRGLLIDDSGDIIVADCNNNLVKKISPVSISTLASVVYPEGVCVDLRGNLYVLDVHNGTIDNISGGKITPVASGFDDSVDLAIDSQDNIFVADQVHGLVKEISGDSVRTYATGFNYPSGVAVDLQGNVYVADTNNRALKKILSNGNTVVLADGFDGPLGVAVDGAGNVFVTDSNGIRQTLKMVRPDGTVITLTNNMWGLLNVEADPWGDVYLTGTFGIYEYSTATITSSPVTVNVPSPPAGTPCVIIGRVTYQGMPVQGATVSTYYSSDLTNSTGFYSVDALSGNLVDVTASYNGHVKTIQVNTPANSRYVTGQNIEFNCAGSVSITAGWNLVSWTTYNSSFHASDLVNNASLGIDMVSVYNASMYVYTSYFNGAAAWKNMSLLPGNGYFIYGNKPATMYYSGDAYPPGSLNVTYGWNVLGWTGTNNVMASDVLGRVSASMVSIYNSTTQSFQTYYVGASPAKNFVLKPGSGFFLLSTSPTIQQLYTG